MIVPDKPRLIYGWRDSMLSVARFSGGCTLNGVKYVIRYDLPEQPLEEVRKPAKKSRKTSGTKEGK